QRDLFGLPGAFIEDLDRLAPRRSLAVVDLSKIKYLPLNHAAIMNAPVFDNRPCAMVLAVLAANLGAQKHDADSRLAHGRARSLVGTTGVCADLDPSNPMTCRDQTPRKSQISRSVGEVGLGWHRDLVTARSLTDAITDSEPLTRRVIARLGLEEAEKLASDLKVLAAMTSAFMEEPWARALAERQLADSTAMSRVRPTALAFLSEARQLVDERAAFVARPV